MGLSGSVPRGSRRAYAQSRQRTINSARTSWRRCLFPAPRAASSRKRTGRTRATALHPHAVAGGVGLLGLSGSVPSEREGKVQTYPCAALAALALAGARTSFWCHISCYLENPVENRAGKSKRHCSGRLYLVAEYPAPLCRTDSNDLRGHCSNTAQHRRSVHGRPQQKRSTLCAPPDRIAWSRKPTPQPVTHHSFAKIG